MHRRRRLSLPLILLSLTPVGPTGCDAGLDLDPALADAPLPAPTDPVDDSLADAGAWLFRRNCSACHQIGGGSVIGPDLAGVTRRRTMKWIAAMIRRPDSMLAFDTIAVRLLADYQVPMADRRLDGARIRALLEFLRRADHGPAGPPSVEDDTTTAGIAWDRAGSGPTVVLIPGTNLDRRIWTRVGGRLALDHTVVRYDPRSHGHSVDADGPWSDLDDLAGVLRGAGVEQATLVGLSAGASTALEFALEHPARVTRLVLVSPSVRGFVPEPGDMPDMFGELVAALGSGDTTAIADALLALPTFAVEPTERALVDSMARANLRLFRVDPAWARTPERAPPLDRLAEVTVPVRIIYGTADLRATARLARRLDEGLDNAVVDSIIGGPHLLPLTHADAILGAVGEGPPGGDAPPSVDE